VGHVGPCYRLFCTKEALSVTTSCSKSLSDNEVQGSGRRVTPKSIAVGRDDGSRPWRSGRSVDVWANLSPGTESGAQIRQDITGPRWSQESLHADLYHTLARLSNHDIVILRLMVSGLLADGVNPTFRHGFSRRVPLPCSGADGRSRPSSGRRRRAADDGWPPRDPARSP
jgi:hypothetical protein